MEKEKRYIGFLKYKGNLVKDGYMDTRKSAQAILGFDEAVRFFVFQQSPSLKKENFEFPVRIRKGSWEISVSDILKIAAGAYLVKASHKMAENDFDEIGLKDVFKKALQGIQWVIKIGKHLGDLAIKEFIDVSYRENNELIGIKNKSGDVLYVPRNFLGWYVSASPKLLSKISDLVEDERVLSIGVFEKGELVEESINSKSKQIFTHEEDDNDILFPDLIHDQSVTLEGEITRGNEVTNSIGLDYSGHILNCSPLKGSIVKFKKSLFLKCRMFGTVCRLDDKGFITAKKPKIIFNRIEPLEFDAPELPIFK